MYHVIHSHVCSLYITQHCSLSTVDCYLLLLRCVRVDGGSDEAVRIAISGTRE